MTWEDKLAALTALTGQMTVSLMMRKPGDWYVTHRGTEVKNGAVLEGRYGNGTTPEEAVEDHWLKFTTLGAREYLVLHAGCQESRRAVRWNGYMWEDAKEAQP